MEDWRERLIAEGDEFLKNTVVASFEKLRGIVEKSERDVGISLGERHISLKASREGEEEFSYTFFVTERPPQDNYPSGFVYPYIKITITDKTASIRNTEKLPLKSKDWKIIDKIKDLSEGDIIRNFTNTFRFQLRNVLD